MSRKEPYACEQCGQGWEDLRAVDTQKCSQETCLTIMCPDCRARCWACGRVFCKAHLKANLQGWYECEPCGRWVDPDEDKHEGHSSQCSVRETAGCNECDCGFDIAEAARRIMKQDSGDTAKGIVDEAVKP